MPKSKTYFPQVPVEIAKKVAEDESAKNSTEQPKRTKKKSADGKKGPNSI